ncbi:MAG: ABC transporter ATP-binding protein [Anaerolineaceae bacterium]|nr:ABC transporter ATP-binding protein [Anaerolineaceae bacterium]
MSESKQPVVIFSEVIKHFGEVQALRGISFELFPGEAFAILGHNGAGKTTSIRLLLGLLKPDSGTVNVFGRDPYPEDEPNRALRRHIGVVQEEDRLYLAMSAEENLLFWLSLYGVPANQQKGRASSVLTMVGLEQRARGKVGTFSKGMRRRLAIARALALEPQVLILDEPTVGLDPEARVEVRKLLEGLVHQKGLTLLMTSHDLDEVEKLCEKLLFIDSGQVLLAGSLADLRAGQQPELSIKLVFKNGNMFPDPLFQELTALPFVARLALEGNLLTVIFNQGGEETISQVITRLTGAGIGIAAVEPRQLTLEEIYLQTTENHKRISHEKN